MKNDSAMSDLQPWNTTQTQPPLNIMKIQFKSLAKKNNQNSFSRAPANPQQINEQRRKNLSQSAQPHHRYKPKTATWNFQYHQPSKKSKRRITFSQSKIEKLLEKTSQTTPVKSTQLSTQMTKSQLCQTDCTIKFTPYHSNNGLLQFTNTAIQQVRNKNKIVNKKVSFSQFMDIKKKELKHKKYPKRTDIANWPQLSQTIHVKHPPHQCISILEDKSKLNSFNQFLSDQKHFDIPLRQKKDRRRLISTKKCSSFKMNTNTQGSKLVVDELKSFSLILPN